MIQPRPPTGAPRLLFLLSSLRVAGAELQAIRYAQYFQNSLGAAVQVLGLGPPEDLVAHLEAAALAWSAVHDAEAHADGFAAALAQRRPDGILAFDWPMNLAAARCWQQSGARLFVWNQRDAGGFGPTDALRAAARHVPLFLSNSTHARDYLLHALGADPQRIAVVPNAMVLSPPAEPRAAFRARLRLQNRPLGVMVANIHGRKDHPTLLRAWAEVKAGWKQGPSPILLLAGRVDDRSIPLLARELGMQEDVRFLGPCRDVSSVLHGADFAVYSSRSEGLPSGVLESLAAGLPLAATDIPGIREAAGAAEPAFFAAPGNPAALAGAIFRLTAELQRRARHGLPTRKSPSYQTGDSGAETYARAVLAAL